MIHGFNQSLKIEQDLRDAIKGDEWDALNVWASKSRDINISTKICNGNTYLYYASICGSVCCVKGLLGHGATLCVEKKKKTFIGRERINISEHPVAENEDYKLESPLMGAIKHGKIKCIKAIVKHAKSTELQKIFTQLDEEGRSIMHLIFQRGVFTEDERQQVVAILVAAGVDVNMKDANGLTTIQALKEKHESKNDKSITMLISFGASHLEGGKGSPSLSFKVKVNSTGNEGKNSKDETKPFGKISIPVKLFKIHKDRNRSGAPRSTHSSESIKTISREEVVTKTSSIIGLCEDCDKLREEIRKIKAKREAINKISMRIGVKTKAAGSARISLDELEFGKILGKGEFGEVYKGKWRGKTVAIKKLLLPGSSSSSSSSSSSYVLRQEFFQEVSMLGIYSLHPNIIQLLGICTEPEICMVLHFCENGSLDDHIRHINTLSSVLTMAKGVCEALAYLHSNGVVHNDIAPRNLLVGDLETNELLLSDLGLSRFIVKEMTSTRAMKPLIHSAPERLQYGEYSPATDVWAVAVTIVQMISGGGNVFNVTAGQQIMQLAMHGALYPEFPSYTPPELQHLLDKCFSPEPEERPNAAELATGLDELLEKVQAGDISEYIGKALPTEENKQLGQIKEIYSDTIIASTVSSSTTSNNIIDKKKQQSNRISIDDSDSSEDSSSSEDSKLYTSTTPTSTQRIQKNRIDIDGSDSSEYSSSSSSEEEEDGDDIIIKQIELANPISRTGSPSGGSHIFVEQSYQESTRITFKQKGTDMSLLYGSMSNINIESNFHS